MLEFLDQIDAALFMFINVSLQNPVFDWFMPFITEKTHWFPVWAFAIVYLLWKGGKTGRIVVILIIPIIFLSDQVSSQVLKPFFERTRPCVALEGVHLLVKKKTSFSFPSSHAANFFATATLFSYYYRKYMWWFLGIAAAVGLSRISIGVHYPFDVLAGAVLGALCTAVVIFIYTKIESSGFLRSRR